MLKIRTSLPVFLFFSAALAFSQFTSDITKKNSDRELVKLSGIKTKSVWEHRYVTQTDLLADSGFKSFYFSFDSQGNIVEYKKYHVSPELSVKEIYTTNKKGNIVRTDRFNSAGDRIEVIEYKYNSQGRIKRQLQTAYLNMVQPGVYFTILASTLDGELFGTLQDELQIEPRFETYTITVNISDAEDLNQYIVIGDEADPTSPRYSFSQLSLASQKELLEYCGPNRKEHTTTSRNVALVTYLYDKSGNLKEKSTFNTADDLIEKESFYYNTDNLKTNYYKYNENGRVSSKETYVYDAKRRLIEAAGLEPDGKITSKLLYKYDDNDRLIEKVWVNSFDEVNGVYKYSYDSVGRLAEEVKYRGENEKESTLSYKYDDKGNILEIVKYDSGGKKERLIKYIYELY